MRRPLRRLEGRDQEVLSNTRRFLDQRLGDPAVLSWAAALGPDAHAERRAVRDSVEFPRADIGEPMGSAWRCVIESWSQDDLEGEVRAIQIRDDIARGVDPRFLLAEMVRIVHPRLGIERYGVARPSRGAPREVSDLLHVRLSSPGRALLGDLGLAECEDGAVLAELVDRLDAALLDAASWSMRLGPGADWAANYVARVYPAPLTAGEDDDEDPDRYREGFAPIAKLYSEALGRLLDISPASGASRMARLFSLDWPLAQRLWATAARRRDAAAAASVGAWLSRLPDDRFWDEDRFPEVFELRALRFADLEVGSKAAVEARIRRGPPARFYRRGLEREVRDRVRTEDAVREMLRLTTSGGALSPASRRWLGDRPDAVRAVGAVTPLSKLYETARYVPNASVPAYTLDEGRAVLLQLQTDLQGRLYVEGRTACDFVAGNLDAVLDLVTDQSDPEAFGRVWAAILATDRDSRGDGVEAVHEPIRRQERLLTAIVALPAATLAEAADGVSVWLDAVGAVFSGDARYRTVWTAAWPAAANQTNVSNEARGLSGEDDDEEKLATNALNSSAGRMMSAFMATLPNLRDVPKPFDDPLLAEMRDAVVASRGETRRQGLYRLLLALPYLRRADPEWTDTNLLAPLSAMPEGDASLWDAISRIGLLGPETLAIIGPKMVAAAQGGPLSSEVRARLAERIILPVAIALEQGVAPPLSAGLVEQMLRQGGDRLRSRCGSALTRWLSSQPDRGEAYRRAVAVLISEWWPKDRSARSAELADALAGMPVAAGPAFSECVKDLSHLLMPFSAWSLWEYGLYDRSEDDARRLVQPASAQDAAPLLKLLDLTIGEDEDAVVPHDLGRALEAIVAVSPVVATTRSYQRLASQVRR